MSGERGRDALQWAGVAALAAIYLAAFALRLPYHMDEFLGFHALACAHYPGNAENIFRSSCSGYDLALWDARYLPLRSYDYVGSLPGALYWPLFRLFPAPWSARLLGPLALALQALLAHRLFGLQPLLAYALLLLLLPYSIGHTIDFGTLIPQTTAVFVVAWATERWLAALRDGRSSSALHPLLAGAVVVLAVWSKVSFLFVVPGLALAVGVQVLAGWWGPSRPAGKGWRAIGEASLGALVALGPTFLLLSAHTRDGEPYLGIVTGSPVLPLTAPGAVLMRSWDRFVPFLANPLRSAGVFLWAPERWTPTGLLLLALAAALLVAGFAGPLARDRATRLRVTGWLAAAALTVWLVTLSLRSWAMHHLALAAPFLLLANFETLSRLPSSRWRRLGVATFLGVNLILHAQLLGRPVRERASHQLPAINAELDREFAATHVLVLVDWGLYYVKSLYGPREQVVLHHWKLLRPGQLAAVREVAARLDRPLAFVGRRKSSSDWALIRAGVPGLVEHHPSVPFDDWTVLYQPLAPSPLAAR